MEDIQVEAVFEAVRELTLASSAPAPRPAGLKRP
jgi:hypothetical protein